jgi:hypothetical protein
MASAVLQFCARGERRPGGTAHGDRARDGRLRGAHLAEGCARVGASVHACILLTAAICLLRHADFVPFDMGRSLEPFLRLMSYGNFHLRASPFCGMVAWWALPGRAKRVCGDTSLAAY